MEKLMFFLITMVCVSIPASSVLADVEIVEIMYDLEGSDSGNEWIEVINNTSDTVDLNDWHFFEANVHHGLVVESGSSQIDAGERAIIVQNFSNFEALFDTSARLFKSSFSLNNTGETLAVSDPDKNISHQVSYDSGDGANGDGKSLQLVGNVWKVGDPTPGEQNSGNTTSTNTETQDDTDNEDYEEDQSNNNDEDDGDEVQEDARKDPEYYTSYIDFDDVVVARSGAFIEAGVYRHSGSKKTHRRGGIYRINFGDGTYLEQDDRIEMHHTYEYPGEYMISFEYFDSQMRMENNEDPRVSARKLISVIDVPITIESIGSEGGIHLQNSYGEDVDISGWSIRYYGQKYEFPHNSFIAEKGSLGLSRERSGIAVSPNSYGIELVNEVGVVIDSYSKKVSHKAKTNQRLLSNTTITPAKTSETISLGASVVDARDGFLAEYQQENPGKEIVDFGESKYAYQAQSTSSENKSSPWYLLGGLGVLVAGLGVARKRNTQQSNDDSSTIIGDIELIE